MTEDTRFFIVLGTVASHLYLIGVFVYAMVAGLHLPLVLALLSEGVIALTYALKTVPGGNYTDNPAFSALVFVSWLAPLAAGLTIL